MLVEGLPVMTMERTIADLVDDNKDLSLVGDALRDASSKRALDLQRFHELLAPFAIRDGFRKGEGNALLQRLMEIAGIDPDALARRVAKDETLGSLVAAKYVGGLSKTDLNRINMTPEMEKTLRTINESLAATLQRALAPQLAEINARSQTLVANLVKDSGIDEVLRKFSTQVVTPKLMNALSQGFGAAKVKSPIGPETLAMPVPRRRPPVMPEIQPYPTSAGVEAAIKDAAKKATAADSSLDTNERIRLEFFNRFLSRIFSEGDSSEYEDMAKTVPYCADFATVDLATALVTRFIDPALGATADGKTWSHNDLAWT